MELNNDSHELMFRRNNGLEVFLMWHKEANVLSIVMHDEQADPPLDTEFLVPNDKGMHAFEHPYAWLPDKAVKV